MRKDRLVDQLRKMEARLRCMKALGFNVDVDIVRIAGTRRTLGIAKEPRTNREAKAPGETHQ